MLLPDGTGDGIWGAIVNTGPCDTGGHRRRVPETRWALRRRFTVGLLRYI